MARYVYIENYSERGKLAISRNVFDSLVVSALLKVKGIAKPQNRMKKDQRVRLNRPVITDIKNGIVHVWIAIDVSKEADLRATIKDIQEEVEHTLLVATETIPFDIQVKVESLV